MAMAPIVGVYLTQYYGWRSNFAAIALLALLGLILVACWVPETLAVGKRQRFEFRLLVQNYRQLLSSQRFVSPMVGLCFLVTPYFVFVGIISLLFIEELKLSMDEYVVYQGSIVAVFAVGSLLISLIGNRLNLDRWINLSIGVCFLAAMSLTLHGLFLPDSALSLTVLMCILTAGLVVPCTVLYVRATGVFLELQASSSALFQSVRMLMLSIGTAIAGSAYNGYYAPIGLLTGVSVLLAVVLLIPTLREKTNAEELSRLATPSH